MKLPIVHLPNPPRVHPLAFLAVYTASGVIVFAVLAILHTILR